MIKLKKGTLCYFISDTQHFQLKCKVLRVEKDRRQDGKVVGHVVARITTQTYQRPRQYQIDPIITSESIGSIIPREAYLALSFHKPFEIEIDNG